MAIFAFHKTDQSFSIGFNNYKPARLRKLLASLIQSQHQFISLDAYLDAPATDRGLIALTFDDGYESFFRHAFPLLQELSIPATLFIPAAFIGDSDRWDYSNILRTARHLNRNQIRELSDEGIAFGSHGYSHACLVGMTGRLLKLEMERSRGVLEDITGRRIRYISYPFGRFDRRVESYALEAGYEKGFSLSSFRKSDSGFTLARHGIYAVDTPYSVARKIDGSLLSRLERLKGAVINAYASGTIFLNHLRKQNIQQRH
ncbi:MAG: polysaccharide deacetylase family protein [Candidatus Zixiibacteriota bacterium]|nr:MAG: polysaccharide deacetylase family protein [candidate division Zixibacteria bacterium]